MKNSDSDIFLLEGLKNRDKALTEQIYREYFPMIRAMILANNGSEADGADIFQEAMIILFEKSQDAEFELISRLGTFIYSISRNLWLKKLQGKNRFHLSAEGLEEEIPVEEEIQKHEQLQQQFDLMESAMAKLGEPCKSLIKAYYILKKPMNQIAEEFGYTNSDNAKTQKYKCLVRLKKIFFAGYNNKN